MKIRFVSDAWETQVNGGVRILKATRRQLEQRGPQTRLISPLIFRALPAPADPEISLALTSIRAMGLRIDRYAADCKQTPPKERSSGWPDALPLIPGRSASPAGPRNNRSTISAARV